MLNVLIESAISDGVFPGCQVAFGTLDDHWSQHYGALTYAKHAPLVGPDTHYDLASLTKVLSSTLSAMTWVEHGLVNLDDSIGEVLPSFCEGSRARVTLWHLLTHTSGLPAHRDFYKIPEETGTRWEAILNEPLESKPGSQVVYSCVGFLVMQKFFEAKLRGKDFFEPLIKFQDGPDCSLRYVPDGIACAPTEIVDGEALVGIVHDENSRSLGGRCANAGLFGDASSVAFIAKKWLQKDFNGIAKSTIENWTTRQLNTGTRALGWDTKSETGSSAGSLFGPRSFGHTGFTGTSIWIDPDAGFYAVLLTNRVHPTRENTKIIDFRPKFYDAVYEMLSSNER